MPPRAPPERTRTDREALRDALVPGRAFTPRELSKAAGISEDSVFRDLEHLKRSIEAEGGKLVVHPAECLGCGFVFTGRSRTTRPGKCPECRATRISPPSFERLDPEGEE